MNPTVPEKERDIEADDALLDSSFDTKNFDSEERRLRKEIYLILIFSILFRYLGKTIETWVGHENIQSLYEKIR